MNNNIIDESSSDNDSTPENTVVSNRSPASSDVLISDETESAASSDIPISNGPVSSDIPISNGPVSSDIPISNGPVSSDILKSNGPVSSDIPISNGLEKDISAADLPNGDLKSTDELSTRISVVDLPGYPQKVLNSAIASNTDLVSQIKVAAGGSCLKKIKKPNEDGRTMVFAFGLPNQPAMNGPSIKQDETPKQVVLEGEFDPKNFLEKVPKVDENGQEIPPGKQRVLARQLAEKAKEVDDERRQFEEKEARLKNVPVWKRVLIEKKETEAKAERERMEKANQKRAATKSASWQKKTELQS